MSETFSMQNAHIWFLSILLALLAGCVHFPTIYSEQPLGESNVLDPKEWNGLWFAASERKGEASRLYRLTVVDAEKGIIASHKWKISQGVCSEVSDLGQSQLWHSRRWYFAYGVDEKPPYETKSVTIRDGDAVVEFRINIERAQKLVEQGLVPGRAKGHDVAVGKLSKEHYKLLFPSELLPINEWEAEFKRPWPVFWDPESVFVKLPPELDPCKEGEK